MNISVNKQEALNKAWYKLRDAIDSGTTLDNLWSFMMNLKAAIDLNPENGQAPTDPDEDRVNHPSHYQSYSKNGIECIEAMKDAFGTPAVAHFCLCNAFKYIWRHSSKNGMEDIDKALWYLNKYKEYNVIDLGE